MPWQRTKRAILETREFDGKQVNHVIGWVDQRHCGCYFVEGMRLDKNEPTAGAGHCDLHEAQVNRAFETYTLMPPSERVAHELWEELLEHEINEKR